MRPRLVAVPAAALAAALPLVGAGLFPAAASAALAQAPAAAKVVKVLDCAGKAVSLPRQFVLSCADANSLFGALHWRSWTASGATATGTYRANDCVPNCAAGHFHSYPGTLAFASPKSTAHGQLFSVVRYSYTQSTSETWPTKPLG